MSIEFSRLRRFRKERGMSQEDVAERLGVSRQAVAKWERGESLPDIESCLALAELYETTLDLLVRGLGREESTADGKHIFGVSRMNDKGQITLPASCRRVFGLTPGDSVLVLGDEDRGIALIRIDPPADSATDPATDPAGEEERQTPPEGRDNP